MAIKRLKALLRDWLHSDGLNHDWDGEWADEDAEGARKHLEEVEARAPMEDKLNAWTRWL